jgi:hypothetical protein
MLTTKSKPDFGFLPFRPRKLISLWDMILFGVGNFLFAFNRLHIEHDRAYFKNVELGNDSTASEPEKEWLKSVLAELRHYAVWIEATEALGRIDKFSAKLSSPNPCNYLVILSEIDGIKDSVVQELVKRKFVYVHTSQIGNFENERLFGSDVEKAFPSIRIDLMEAGNCAAFDLHTAAVFHLMRVVERGLRALAKSLGIDKINEKELEYVGLNPLIVEVEKTIETVVKPIALSKNSEQKDDDLRYYRGLLVELRHFKDVDRDPVSHTRKTYDPETAPVVFRNVESFMKRLAERVSETK